MFRTLGVAVATIVATISLAGTVYAAQTVTMNDTDFDASGIASPYGNFNAPPAGYGALVTIRFSGGDILPSAYILSMREVTFTYWDHAMDAVWGNEYTVELDCSVANGCIRLVKPGLAIAKLATPRDWYRDCTPATVGDCSLRYWDGNWTSFEGAFVSNGTSDAIHLNVSVSDFAPIPEPATWAMMIAGFGLSGAALRRRRTAHA